MPKITHTQTKSYGLKFNLISNHLWNLYFYYIYVSGFLTMVSHHFDKKSVKQLLPNSV